MNLSQFLADNRTKILGTATTLVAGVLGMIALGMFDATATSAALLSPFAIRWITVVLTLANLLLGGGTIAVGVANASNVRVAEANATVATAMQTALNTPPPGETTVKTTVITSETVPTP